MFLFRVFLAAVLAAFVGTPAFADSADKEWYFGVGVTGANDIPSAGLLSFEGPEARYSLSGLDVKNASESKKKTSTSIFFGGAISKRVALELSYTQGLSSSASMEGYYPVYNEKGGEPQYWSKYLIQTQRDIRSLGVSLLWTWKPDERVRLFARTGVERRMLEDWESVEHYYRNESGAFVRSSGVDDKYRRSYDFGSHIGAGVEYYPWKDVGIRVEYSDRTGGVAGKTFSLLREF